MRRFRTSITALVSAGVLALLSLGCHKAASGVPSRNGLPMTASGRASEAIVISAIELHTAYADNPVSADRRFRGRRVRVEGRAAVKIDAEGRYFIAFGVAPQENSSGPWSPGVRAFIASGAEQGFADLQPGTPCVLTGVCRGCRPTTGTLRGTIVDLVDARRELPPAKRTHPVQAAVWTAPWRQGTGLAGPGGLINVRAEDLHAAYVANPVNADRRFKNKHLYVTGRGTLKKEANGTPLIAFEVGTRTISDLPPQKVPGVFVYLSRDPQTERDFSGLKPGSLCSVIGFCEGSRATEEGSYGVLVILRGGSTTPFPR